MKHITDESLESSRSISEAKRHNQVRIISIGSIERSLLHIPFSETYKVVSVPQIKSGTDGLAGMGSVKGFLLVQSQVAENCQTICPRVDENRNGSKRAYRSRWVGSLAPSELQVQKKWSL